MEMERWVSDLAPWEVIAHLTFRWEAGLMSAAKAFERFMGRDLDDVSYFYAVEQNPSRDGHHVHALWAHAVGVQRSRAWRKWFDRFGRARIEPVRSHEDVSNYCAKYVAKECAWWNVKLSPATLRGTPSSKQLGQCGRLLTEAETRPCSWPKN